MSCCIEDQRWTHVELTMWDDIEMSTDAWWFLKSFECWCFFGEIAQTETAKCHEQEVLLWGFETRKPQKSVE